VRRAIYITAVVLTALLLQSTLFAQISLGGAKPELIYLVTIVVALLDGPASGAAVGFAGGMAQDFLLNAPKGITALTLTLLGYVVGTLRTYATSPSPLLPLFLVGAATFAGVLFHGFVSYLLGQLGVGFGYLSRVALLSALYNALLTPLFYPVIRRVNESSRARRIFRW
jgi:rod shape-determining protein MreD